MLNLVVKDDFYEQQELEKVLSSLCTSASELSHKSIEYSILVQLVQIRETGRWKWGS